jgi:hypothetical protein
MLAAGLLALAACFRDSGSIDGPFGPVVTPSTDSMPGQPQPPWVFVVQPHDPAKPRVNLSLPPVVEPPAAAGVAATDTTLGR